MSNSELFSLEQIYQYIEDNYDFDGDESKTLIASFIDTSAAWLDNCDPIVLARRNELAKIAINLAENADGIGFAEFRIAAENFLHSLRADDVENCELHYRTMVILLNRLKNDYHA